jgi:hypothetical protein
MISGMDNLACNKTVVEDSDEEEEMYSGDDEDIQQEYKGDTPRGSAQIPFGKNGGKYGTGREI